MQATQSPDGEVNFEYFAGDHLPERMNDSLMDKPEDTLVGRRFFTAHTSYRSGHSLPVGHKASTKARRKNQRRARRANRQK